MSVLTPDYERLQNPSASDNELVKEYRTLFGNRNISGAQGLINQDNAYLVMNASKLNDLVDTINYMQQIWADDKQQFTDWYFGMTQSLEVYNSGDTYHTGAIVLYDNLPYFCIADDTTGAWDSSKWILLKQNELGIYIIGEMPEDTSSQQSGLYWSLQDNNIIEWIWYDAEADTSSVVAYTYPNIRYLSDETQALDDEVYITDYDVEA